MLLDIYYMFEWLFGKKNEINGLDELKEGTKKGFDSIKNDLNNISKWLKHLNGQDSEHEERFDEIEGQLSSIKTDLENIKNSVAFVEGSFSKRLFKQPQTAVHKQTAVVGVQYPVQTAVQTGGRDLFNALSLMERALVYVLLNSGQMKLSYDDLAATLGKSRATIRGQVNSIKQKSEGLIEEIIEANGKKRVFIPEEIKDIMLKNAKVRVNRGRKVR